MPTDATAGRIAPPPSQPYAAAPARRRSHTRLKLVGAAAILIAALVVAIRLIDRAHDQSELKRWTAAQAVPVVSIVNPTADVGSGVLTLPGNLQAYYNAPIYSRVSGYVRSWTTDIGAHVKAGQVLATIDTPELDAQIVQARADLQSAQANQQLAATTAQRWTKLLAEDAVSKQETEEKAGDLAVKTAGVNASKANLNRLLALKGFARLVAPFDGVVTARKTDIGDLVNAGAGASANSELFDVAKVDPLRLYVRVPQADAARIKPGIKASLTVPEYAGRSFPATLATTANAVNDQSGTLLVELMVDNKTGELKAGDYAQVSFSFPDADPGAPRTLLIPSSALLFRSHGAQVAVLGPGDRVQLRTVTIGRDLGPTLQITSGLAPTDRVIDNPPDSLTDGQAVRVAKPNAG